MGAAAAVLEQGGACHLAGEALRLLVGGLALQFLPQLVALDLRGGEERRKLLRSCDKQPWKLEQMERSVCVGTDGAMKPHNDAQVRDWTQLEMLVKFQVGL